MAVKSFSFKVDFITKNSLCMAHVKQNDNAIFNMYLTQQGQALDLTGQQVRLFVRKPDGKLVVQEKDITVVDVKGGAIKVNVQNSIFQAVGVAVCEIDLWGNDKNTASSGSFLINIDEQLGNNDVVESHVDVNLFRQLSEYVEEALADIHEYKTLFEGFVEAGVSLQGLNDIKAYIDNNLAGLKAEGDRAVDLIPKINKASTDAESKLEEVLNVTATAESKRVEIVDATSKAEEKRLEVVNVISTADTSKNNLITETTNADNKKKELETATANAESKKTEVVNVTNTANATKEQLETATANAEAKRIQVVNITDSAEAKRKELQDMINGVGSTGFVKKSGDTLTGSLDFVNTSNNEKWASISPDGIFYKGQKVYHQGYTPSLTELGAMGVKYQEGYIGMVNPNGDDVELIRTPSKGIIPYASGVSSSLGTAYWKFSDAWINTVNAGKVITNEESLFTNGEKYIDPANGLTCAIKASGHIATTGNFLASGNDKTITLGIGEYDGFLTNSKGNTYFQIKDDGRFCVDNSEIASGKYSIGYDQGSNTMTEGRIHLGGNFYLYWGWFGVSLSDAGAVSRSYVIPNCKRVHSVSVSCYSKDAETTYGELGVLRIQSNGFTVRLYNSRVGGQHYVQYMVVGE